MRRRTPPGTGISGIVPRFGSGLVGLPVSTPCAWPKGLRRLPSLSRQSPHKRSSRFPSRGVDRDYSRGREGRGDKPRALSCKPMTFTVFRPQSPRRRGSRAAGNGAGCLCPSIPARAGRRRRVLPEMCTRTLGAAPLSSAAYGRILPRGGWRCRRWRRGGPGRLRCRRRDRRG